MVKRILFYSDYIAQILAVQTITLTVGHPVWLQFRLPRVRYLSVFVDFHPPVASAKPICRLVGVIMDDDNVNTPGTPCLPVSECATKVASCENGEATVGIDSSCFSGSFMSDTMPVRSTECPVHWQFIYLLQWPPGHSPRTGGFRWTNPDNGRTLRPEQKICEAKI